MLMWYSPSALISMKSDKGRTGAENEQPYGLEQNPILRIFLWG
ncbi:MAG: hypothetical protein ACLVLH_13440 [Eisenbergiella massiliensis]